MGEWARLCGHICRLCLFFVGVLCLCMYYFERKEMEEVLYSTKKVQPARVSGSSGTHTHSFIQVALSLSNRTDLSYFYILSYKCNDCITRSSSHSLWLPLLRPAAPTNFLSKIALWVHVVRELHPQPATQGGRTYMGVYLTNDSGWSQVGRDRPQPSSMVLNC